MDDKPVKPLLTLIRPPHPSAKEGGPVAKQVLRGKADAIAAPLLDAPLADKRRVRFGCRGISRHPHLSAASDAPPFADKAPLPEEIALHGKPLKPVHVLRRIDAVQDDRGHNRLPSLDLKIVAQREADEKDEDDRKEVLGKHG
jgi:hypothetical protein